MRYYDYSQVIAIGECSAGNESVGDMWLETKAFDKNTPVKDIIRWAEDRNVTGKLIITINEPLTTRIRRIK